MTAWKELIKKYADGRSICNCGNAYYSKDGEGYVNGIKVNNIDHCKYGCSSNQLTAKEYIAKRVLEKI